VSDVPTEAPSPCTDCAEKARRLAIYAGTAGLIAGIGVALMILNLVE
jgi:hypothetical protein